MGTCSKCGRQLTDNDLIYWKCPKCGKVFNASFLKLKNLQKQKQARHGQSLLKCPGCGYGIDDGNERMIYKCAGCGSTTGGNLENFVRGYELSVADDIIKCQNCGKELDKNMKFCPTCGKSVALTHHGKRKNMIICISSILITLFVMIVLIASGIIHIPIKEKVNPGNGIADVAAECAHKYDDGTVTKKSTCAELGIKTYTCIYCKETKTEKIAMKRHKYIEKTTKKPTFETEGTKTYTCKSCGYSYTRSIPRRNDEVVVKVNGKSSLPKDMDEYRYSDMVEFNFTITNKTKKTIRGIQGTLIVYDMFGEKITSIGCDFTGKDILKKQTVSFDNRGVEINIFDDNLVKLYNTDFKDLEFKYNITDIVYTDEILEINRIKSLKTKNGKTIRIRMAHKEDLDIDYNVGRYSMRTEFSFVVYNSTQKDIKGIQGVITIKDLFNEDIMSFNLDFTGNVIPANGNAVFPFLGVDISILDEEECKLYNTDLQDLNFDYKINSIVYTDGTSE